MKYVSRLLEAILGEYIGFFPAIVMLGPSQTRNLRIDERATGHEKFSKEASGHLDHHFSGRCDTPLSIFGSLTSLLDSVGQKEPDRRKMGKDELRRKKMFR
jgi:hypothetical protein